MNIATEIQFKRFDRDFNLLGIQSQKCRSFVKQLWELMYVTCAQIDPLTPRNTVTDVSGQIRGIDKTRPSSDSAFSQSADHNLESTLALVAPGGYAAMDIATQVQIANFSSQSRSLPGTWSPNRLSGQSLGICVGTGNTAVAPNDFHLYEKLGHGLNPANAVASILVENSPVDTSDVLVYATRFQSVQFAVYRQITCTKIALKLYRQGAIGNIVLHLNGITPNQAPSTSISNGVPELSSDIASVTVDASALTTVSPGIDVDFVFATPVELQAGMHYAITLTKALGDATNNIHWRIGTGSSASNAHALGTTDSGVTWTNSTLQLFKLYGTTRTEIEYGSCDIHNISVANPNASFKISRLFYNNSGESVTLNECGIYAAGKRVTNAPNGGYPYWNSQPYPFCIARDLIAPGIVFNNGEVLQVTYTPAVTV